MIWKAYFWFIMLITISSALWAGFLRTWEFVDFAMSLVAFAGLYGFAWRRTMFFRLFWEAFFPLYMMWSLLYRYFVSPAFVLVTSDGKTVVPTAINATVQFAPFLPTLLALFLYAYVSDDLWGHDHPHEDASSR